MLSTIYLFDSKNKTTLDKTNEFFDENPNAKKAATAAAIGTMVAVPGGILAGPAAMEIIDQKEAKKQRKKAKKIISEILGKFRMK